jgi:phosphoadenosine phosphosulfate reductase
MNFDEIKTQIESYRSKGLKLFTTSSFQTHSLVLLHMLSRIDKLIPVYFINTGFHFPETLSFKEEIANLFELDVRDVVSGTPKNMQRDALGRLLFTSDPDHCCYLNKTQPLEAVLAEHDVWINGVRADQSSVRKNFKIEESASFDTLRFHPMLEWTPKMIYYYLKEHNIPRHPLELKGYQSIGCEPCTRKCDLHADIRQGRWFGLKKTECGLNTQLITTTV